MDDIELYEFFKSFSCKYFDINYDHYSHSWSIMAGYKIIEIPKEDLIKLESQIEELKSKYFPKQKPMEYIPEKKD